MMEVQNETDIVENIHFQNPSSDINVKDAELTIDTGIIDIYMYIVKFLHNAIYLLF